MTATNDVEKKAKQA